MPAEIRTDEFCRITGATPRQAQWWDETGLIVPAIRSHTRFYKRFDVALASLVLKFRDKGVSMHRLRPVVDKIQNGYRPIFEQSYATGGHVAVLDSDGDLTLAPISEHVLGLACVTHGPVWVVSIGLAP